MAPRWLKGPRDGSKEVQTRPQDDAKRAQEKDMMGSTPLRPSRVMPLLEAANTDSKHRAAVCVDSGAQCITRWLCGKRDSLIYHEHIVGLT